MFNPATKRNDKKRAEAAAAAKQASHTEKTTEKSSDRDPDSQSGLADLSDKLGKNEKFLIQNFNGVLKSGEMALVLGRPGAGCTTFMKVNTRC